MRNFTLAMVLLFAVACKPTISVQEFDFVNDIGYIEHFSTKKENKPVAVFIPENYQSLGNKDLYQSISKKYNLKVVHFPADTNLSRLNSIDNLSNRRQYYGRVLEQIINENDTIEAIFAEGLNASVVAEMIHNFGQPNFYLVNPWLPNIEQIILNNCFNETTCDSLQNYIAIASNDQLLKLIEEINAKHTSSNSYGYLRADVWQQVFSLNTPVFLDRYKGDKKLIYTNNTGLLPQSECQKLAEKNKNAQAKRLCISVEEFYKIRWFSN